VAEIGETLVAAWYQYVDEYELVVEGVRLPRQGELDVLAVAGRRVIAAEVATHILNLDYGGYHTTERRVADKVERAASFLATNFPEHERHVAFWSPRVPSGLAQRLTNVAGVELVINDEYTRRLQQLVSRAASDPGATSNSAYRVLQVLTHVKGRLELPGSGAERTGGSS
jgi:Holliday junction resolvase-like predicted endonuclease